jgi:hypothetical protein
MTSDRDVYATANLLLRQHGETAWLVALQRCDAMIEAGDAEGLAVWRRISAAVEALSDQKPNGSTTH